MNTYKLDLNGGGGGIQQTELPTVLKVLAYIAMFGQNVVFRNSNVNREEPVVPALVGDYVANPEEDMLLVTPVIIFDLPFSLSNITLLDQTATGVGGNSYYLLQTVVYDSETQNVVEYVDKPYPVKGYLCVSMYDPQAIAPKSQPEVDLDNFRRFNIAIDDGLGVVQITQIFVGRCNSSKTDFYTPFENSPSVFFDMTKINGKR